MPPAVCAHPVSCRRSPSAAAACAPCENHRRCAAQRVTCHQQTTPTAFAAAGNLLRRGTRHVSVAAGCIECDPRRGALRSMSRDTRRGAPVKKYLRDGSRLISSHARLHLRAHQSKARKVVLQADVLDSATTVASAIHDHSPADNLHGGGGVVGSPGRGLGQLKCRGTHRVIQSSSPLSCSAWRALRHVT